MQFGCFVQRGYYPRENPRLRGTFIVSPAQDVLPLFLDAGGSVSATAADVRAERTLWIWRFGFSTRSLFASLASRLLF